MELFSQEFRIMQTPSDQQPAPDYRQNFQLELRKLNKAQLQAVQTIEGPVMVIAGPGTGKTQVLSARIGYILENTDARAENILCLTYTDSGALAMRKRLLQLIGADAYRLNISTFHSFCNNVIQANLDYFGMDELQLISELEVNELLREMIDSLPIEHPLKRISYDPYLARRPMYNLFRLMKNEGWTPDYLCAQADAYIQSLPDRENFQYKRDNSTKGIKKGDPKILDIQKETDRMEQLKAAARQFPRYLELMRQRKRYDFDDMLLWVHDAFEKHPDLLLNYQEQFLYVLVDEYQDTNGIQNKLLHQLTGYWENPNVFVVGDDDQSIYRFQGANVENLLEFKEKYAKSLHVVVLEENYRSSQKILDAAKALIENNRERLIYAFQDLRKNLIAKGENASVSEDPQIREYLNPDCETLHIAKEIMRLRDQGIQLNEVAVLYRRHSQVEDLYRYLTILNIPIDIKRRANVLDATLIRHLIKIFAYIHAETSSPGSGEHLLFEILHFDWFKIQPLVIARLAMDIKNRRRKNNKNIFWREELRNAWRTIQRDLFEHNPDEQHSYLALKKLGEDLEYWIAEAGNITLQNLLEKIVTRGGILNNILQSPEKMWLLEELSTFFDFVKSETAKNPRLDVGGLLAILQTMEQDRIELPVNKISSMENGVRLITAHSAKGLEFDYVFLMGCNRDVWETKVTGNDYRLPDNLVRHIVPAENNDLEEARRLFYVAMTRARKSLCLSYSLSDKKMKEQQECRFIGEITAATGIQPQRITLSEEDLMLYHQQMMTEITLPQLTMIEDTLIRKSLENYSLSVTHLNEYLRCPISFYFKYILSIPTAKNEYLAFGNAMHEALERFTKTLLNEKTLPPPETLLHYFDHALKTQEEAFTISQYQRRLEYGRKILTDYYHQHIVNWNRNVLTETRINQVELDGIPLNGRIDKMEFEGKRVTVIDYKTGKPQNAQKKLLPPDGEYWRQAVFYRILIERSRKQDWIFASAVIEFLEPDDKGTFLKIPFTVSDEDVQILTGQIKTVYNNIMQLQFNTGCNDPSCEWCNFAKSHYQSVPPELKEAEQ
ncbi:MAG: DNA-dependent ATPase [Chitinophagales bacterium]|nr:MAG: DNA-dependent ATPase [Chitinophagales bacterium]